MENLHEMGRNWPMLLDFTKDECKRVLRAKELSTYSSIVSVFRAQGELTKEKKKLLHDIQTLLNISMERHRAEMRRAVNDESLCTIAHLLAGPNTSVEWSLEGRRLIPLIPRAAPLVAYSALATQMAQKYCGINNTLPKPCNTVAKDKRNSMEMDSEGTDSEEETEGLRYLPRSMIPQSINKDLGPYTILPMSESKYTSSDNAKAKRLKVELESPVSQPSIISAHEFALAAKSHLANAAKLSDSPATTAQPIGTSTPSKNSAMPIPVSTSRRKRKRSVIPDSSLPQRQQPVVTLSQNAVAPSLSQLPTISSKASVPQAKLEPATMASSKPNIQKVLPPTHLQQTQKVILVSTSPANSSPEISYIRSNSLSVKSNSPSIGKESISLSTDKPTNTNTVGTTSVNLIGPPSIQMKPAVTTAKPAVQIRQDALGGRMVSRTQPVASSSQNLYVVTTNSGMITVVARTVPSQSTAGGHKVVSVNTVVPRTSLASIKSVAPSCTLSLAPAAAKVMPAVKTVAPAVPLRPALNAATKNNVIVLQRSSIPTNSVRTVGLPGYKESTKMVQRATTTITAGGGAHTTSSINGGGNILPAMLVLKSTAVGVAGPPTKIIPTPTCSITEVPARTISSNLIYVEPNFGGKKTSTIRTTLTLTSTSEGAAVISRMGGEEACRVTPSGRSFAPMTSLAPSSAKLRQAATTTKESEIKRMKDIKENNIPLQQINKFDKNPIKKLGSEPCVTKITKLSTSLTNLYASTMTKKPAILSNNFAFAKSAKKPVKDDLHETRDVDKMHSLVEKLEKKNEAKGKLETKSEFGDDEMSILVERAVEVLRSGDKEQARTLLHKAGLELHESPQDDQVEGESFTISSMTTEQNAAGESAIGGRKGDPIIAGCKDAVTFDVRKSLVGSPLPKRKISDEFLSSIEAEKTANSSKQLESKAPIEKPKLEINPC